MKRFIRFSIVTLLVIIAVAGAYIYYFDLPGRGSSAEQFIPSDAIFIVTLDPSGPEIRSFREAAFLESLSEIPVIGRVRRDIAFLTDSLLTAGSETVIPERVSASFHVTGSGTFDLLYVVELPEEWTTDWISERVRVRFIGEEVTQTGQRTYESSVIVELRSSGDRTFSYTIRDGCLLGSFTPFLVDDALRHYTSKNRDDRAAIEWQPGGGPVLSFYTFYLDRLLNLFTSNESKLNYRSFDTHQSPVTCEIDPDDNVIKMTGHTDNEAGDIFSCFNGQRPLRSGLPDVLPANTSYYLSYTFNDPATFLDRLAPHISAIDRKDEILRSMDLIRKMGLDPERLFRNITDGEAGVAVIEPPVTSYRNNIVAVVRIKDPESAISDLMSFSGKADSALATGSPVVNYRDKLIRRVKVPYLMSVVWGPLFDGLEDHFYVVLDDYLIFGNSRYVLQFIIDAHKGKKSLASSPPFKEVDDKLSSEGSIHCYVNLPKSWNVFRHHMSDAMLGGLNSYSDAAQSIRGFAFRFINEDSLKTDFESVLSFGSGDPGGATLLYSEQLDTVIGSRPFIVEDPAGGGKNILVQDMSNTLYLLRNDGEIAWKKQLNEQIQSDIYEVDYFSNGSRQYLFNTDEYLFMIDRSGNPVGNFPIRLPSAASAPLTLLRKSISDNRSLIYMPCDNNKVYAYLLNGKPLPGWSFTTTEGVVRNSVVYGKQGEYILFISDDKGNHYLTNVLGEISAKFSTSDILSIQNSAVPAGDQSDHIFYATTLSGGLLRVKKDGTFDEISLSIDGLDHGYTASDIDNDGTTEHFIVSGQELLVYDSELVLMFRKVMDQHLASSVQVVEYSPANRFVVVHSTAGKTWLMDPEGRVLNGFPVKGSFDVGLGSLSEGNAPYLVTAGADGTVYIYSVR